MLLRILLPLLSASVLMAASGESIYQLNCASCHGKSGEKKALGHSKVIKGMPVDKFVTLTKAFARGEKEALPIAKIVKKQFIDRYSDEEIRSVGEYINKL